MVKAMDAWELELSSKSDNTRRQYLDHFQRFCKRWDETPEDIYFIYKDVEDPRDKRKIENMLKIHMKEMRDGGLAASTCRMAYKAMSSFFEAQGLRFSLKAKDLPRGQYNGQRRVKKDQILRLYDLVGNVHRLRNRALMMFLKDSGLRISDVAGLDIEHYRKARTVYDNTDAFKVFEPYETKKTGHYAHIHIGPEAVEDMEKYLRLRNDPKMEEPLFIMRGKKRFNVGALSNVFYRLAQRLGGEGHRISAHSFRKYHTTELEVKLNSSWIAKLQGKSLGGNWGPYSTPEGYNDRLEPEILTKGYIKAYDALRVKSTETLARKDQDKKITVQETRIKELERQLESTLELLEDEREERNRMMEKVTDIDKTNKEIQRLFAEIEKNYEVIPRKRKG
jgi:integrase